MPTWIILTERNGEDIHVNFDLVRTMESRPQGRTLLGYDAVFNKHGTHKRLGLIVDHNIIEILRRAREEVVT